MVAGTEKAIAAAVAPLAAENAALVQRIKALEDRPAPEKGESIKGDAGIGVAGALIDRSGVLVLTLSDGTTRDLGVVVGKDGKDADMPALEKRIDEQVAAIPVPKDGKDGFSLKDFDIERGEDSRTLIFKFGADDIGYEYEVSFPFPIYCGVFKEGDRYVPGDLVTFGGCLWHCDKETTDKPGVGAWTIAVKKGRDGKDAK